MKESGADRFRRGQVEAVVSPLKKRSFAGSSESRVSGGGEHLIPFRQASYTRWRGHHMLLESLSREADREQARIDRRPREQPEQTTTTVPVCWVEECSGQRTRMNSLSFRGEQVCVTLSGQGDRLRGLLQSCARASRAHRRRRAGEKVCFPRPSEI